MAIRNQFKNKKDECSIDELKSDIENDQLYDAILSRKDDLRLDLDIQNFENQCFPVNDLLIKYALFLEIYELKDKFHYLIKQDSEKKTVMRDLSSCVIEKFNGFNIIRVEFSETIRQTYRPIDIIYNPMRKPDEIINYYFSERLNLSFRASYSGGTKIKHCTGWQCYFCSNYYARKEKCDCHFENCTGQPGYVCNFNTRNLVTFEENLKYKGDPLVTYIDFEVAAQTDECLDPENRKMFAVSYVIVFAFHPELDINRVTIERSFGQSCERLTSLSYLTREQLEFKDNKKLLQLRDCIVAVAEKKNKIAIYKMFSTKLKFAADCLLKWFNKKFKLNNLELSNEEKRKYEIKHRIDWMQDRCCLCPFPLEINLTSIDTKRTHCQMLILSFLRNINF